jgi:hypothetical protein
MTRETGNAEVAASNSEYDRVAFELKEMG